MSESTLTLTYADLVTAICLEAGYPTDSSLRSTEQNSSISRALATGLRRAYFPGSVTLKSGKVIEPFLWSWIRDPRGEAVLWPTFTPTDGVTLTSDNADPSVLTPTGTTAFYGTMVGKTITLYSDDDLDTVIASDVVASVNGDGTITLDSEQVAAATYRWGMTADGDYRMEDTFGGATGSMSLDDDIDCKIPFVANSIVRDRRAGQPTLTGRPANVAVVPLRRTTDANPQRWDMRVWPIPDQLYTATFPMVWLPAALTSVLVYHAGGMPYSEVFRTAVIAAAVSMSSDNADGLREAEFRDALQAAALFDMAQRPVEFGSLGMARGMDPRRERVVRTRYWGVSD